MTGATADIEIWQCAQLIVRRYGVDAIRQASARADQVLKTGDAEGCATWRRIVDAIEQLQAAAPAEAKKVH